MSIKPDFKDLKTFESLNDYFDSINAKFEIYDEKISFYNNELNKTISYSINLNKDGEIENLILSEIYDEKYKKTPQIIDNQKSFNDLSNIILKKELSSKLKPNF